MVKELSDSLNHTFTFPVDEKEGRTDSVKYDNHEWFNF